MFYQEYPPHLVLKKHIRCYWTLTTSESMRSERHEYFLAEGMEFSFSLADPVEFVPSDSKPVAIPGSSIWGPMIQPMRARLTPQVELFGICFRPGGAYPFFPHPADELVNAYFKVDDFCGSKSSEIVDRMYCNCHTPRERIDFLNGYFLRSFNPRKDNSSVTTAVAIMEERKGQINIDRLATLMGMSGRHLERRFKEQVGMSPKQLCRNLRFKNIFRHLAAYPADSWVSTALACGYHDQAHMIHDFRRFTGTSPAAYFSKPQATDRYFMGNF